MATGIGEAIGLQNTTKQQGDPLSWIRLAGAEKRQEKAQAKKEKEGLVGLADFKVDGNLLPAWGKAIAEVKMDLLNKFHADYSADSVTAQNKFYQNLIAAKAKVGGLLVSNANAVEQVKLDKSTFNIDDKIQMSLLRDDDFGVIEQTITESGRGSFFHMDKTGAFAYRAIPIVDAVKGAKYVHDKKEFLPKTVRRLGIGDQMIIDERESISDEGVKQMAGAVGGSPQGIDNYLWNNPKDQPLLKSQNPQDQQVLGLKSAEFYYGKLQAGKPVDKISQQPFNPDNPPAGGSGADKKAEAPLQYNTVATVKSYKTRPDGKLSLEKGADGLYKPILEGTSQIKIPLSVALPNSKPVTIQLNDKVFDAETNLYLKGASETVSFKANGIEVVLVKGGYKKYAVGDIVKNVGEGEEELEVATGEKRETVFRIKVPLDETGGVNSMARALNPREMASIDKGYEDFIRANGQGGAKKVITSTSKEAGSWTIDNEYKIGDNIYFYDETIDKWSKK